MYLLDCFHTSPVAEYPTLCYLYHKQYVIYVHSYRLIYRQACPLIRRQLIHYFPFPPNSAGKISIWQLFLGNVRCKPWLELYMYVGQINLNIKLLFMRTVSSIDWAERWKEIESWKRAGTSFCSNSSSQCRYIDLNNYKWHAVIWYIRCKNAIAWGISLMFLSKVNG